MSFREFFIPEDWRKHKLNYLFLSLLIFSLFLIINLLLYMLPFNFLNEGYYSLIRLILQIAVPIFLPFAFIMTSLTFNFIDRKKSYLKLLSHWILVIFAYLILLGIISYIYAGPTMLISLFVFKSSLPFLLSEFIFLILIFSIFLTLNKNPKSLIKLLLGLIILFCILLLIIVLIYPLGTCNRTNEHCVAYKALNNNNPSLCDLHTTPGACYNYLGRISFNPEYCEKVNLVSMKESCFEAILRYNQDNTMYKECFDEIDGTIGTYENSFDECFNYCQEMTEEGLKLECYKQLFLRQKVECKITDKDCRFERCSEFKEIGNSYYERCLVCVEDSIPTPNGCFK